jgi:Na+-exporting ATPase
MGIETLPDVEESTEPPICALGEYTSNSQGTAALSFEPCDANEKPTRVPTSHSSPLSVDLQAPTEPLQSLEDQTRNTHRLEPARIAELLRTDLKYVANHIVSFILCVTKRSLPQQWTF